jgi:hypothetical protein
MPVVELVYDEGCPNVAIARAQLLRAFAQAGMHARWHEWQATDADAPAHVRGYGSPTVLVDGKDVIGTEPTPEIRSCRLYAQADGLRGAPPIEVIVAALVQGTPGAGSGPGRRTGWKGSLAMAPTIGVSLLPKLACPACWPAYAGLLSSLGLGFLIKTSVLLPLTAAFLATAVGALAFRARRRRGFGPFGLGLVAAVVVLAGKFMLESDWAMYGGLLILVVASLWNSWPSARRADACPSCSASRKTWEEGEQR